ncbi:MAG: class I SAM-dependent rRNA methyltransferase [Bacteroidales bacterium]|nr:class I SAM-dependent rRNA methyltransferase [Bacteroidales bacterium]
METKPRLIIAPGKEKALQRRHPWVFSGAVRRIVGNPQDGDLVDIVDSKGQWLATGHFQADESIICKVLSFDTPQVDEAFFRHLFESAVGYRKRLGFDFSLRPLKPLKPLGALTPLMPLTNTFRLVHAEGDGLPGLVADWYNGVVVLQAHSAGMHRLFPLFVDILRDLLGESLVAVFDKSSATLPKPKKSDNPAAQDSADRFIFQAKPIADDWEVCESGNRLLINFYEGQKTGFFIDQRENRALVQSLAEGHRVLNCFGYTGGFSLAALRGGAEYVETVDISRKAVELCNRNVALNFGPDAPHRGVAADVLDYLANPDRNAGSFDFIILDPPAFAKNHRSLQQGLRGYRAINQRAMEALPDGGLLMTFSCSQAVSVDDFRTMVFTAAANAKRQVRVVRTLPHAADHPVSIYHPEGEYLKGLLLEVRR